ncbi:chemotaxis protein CheB [Bacterioplanes sanyensis]|uniref:protein-glutamate methylesterase n=1 Tax=Bacterioplanes sanyensis TaxID=1249553 RepID=A0A222FHE1_9GAMM|nr:chemotaxis protein CheB [Bacterioplanes sanyensis]ASP38179.1 chemotaxis protein CheB [Bacterioplanes sanyensis]
MPAPRIGIVSDDRLQQHLLSSALRDFAFEVSANMDPQRLLLGDGHIPEVDAWLVDVRHEDENSDIDWLEKLLDTEVPVLMGMGKAPQKHCPTFPRWEKRLYAKLRSVLHDAPVVSEDASVLHSLSNQVNNKVLLPPVLTQPASKEPFMVWVLGASLGGPEAVKEFLDALPEGLPLAFVYAQHIDPRFENTLGQSIGRHCDYQMRAFAPGYRLCSGDVLVAPIRQEFCFDGAGLTVDKGHQWPGPYGPSIDQVILNVDHYYGHRAGYILFSGMGNDGSEAIVSLADGHGPIWAQSSSSCASSSMPDSARETGRTSYTGDPYQLALQLVNFTKNYWMETHESAS